MTRVLLTVLMLGGVAGGVPYALLRKMGGVGRSLLAYALGFLISSATSIGLLLIRQAVFPAATIDADRIVGSGVLCAVIGPVLGVLAAKRSRARLRPQS
jgi:hypothetical protein